MLYFNFLLTNPWYKKNKGVKDYASLFQHHGHFCKNKHWELEGFVDLKKVVGFEFSFSLRGRDHAGLEIGLCFLGRDLAFRIYDNRHWDCENNQWEQPNTKLIGSAPVSPSTSCPQ